MAKWQIHQDETGEYGYELRDGKLLYYEVDKSSGGLNVEEILPADFIKHYTEEKAAPFPEIIEALKKL